jgi:tRNA (cmo5U34)-methyltransferase
VTASVGDGIRAAPGSWSFGGVVAESFDVHVARSVPYYNETHRLIERLGDEFLAAGSRGYDLGCSTGALTARLAARHRERPIELLGVDREPQMVAEARARCAAYRSVTIAEADLTDFDLLPADLVVAHYTLHFVPPDARAGVVERIAGALEGGGALLLFEKVKSPDPRLDDLISELYHDWKRAQGYNDAEIAAKARSLDGVLEPFTPEQNRDLLANAGFTRLTTVYRWLNWEGILALAE